MIVPSWLLLAILFIGCGSAEKPEPPTPVVVGPGPRPTRGTARSVTPANILPYAHVELAFKSGGYLTNILQVKGVDGRMRNVQEGDYVKRGVVLAQVRQSDYEAEPWHRPAGQNAAARAALEHADLDLGRARNLYAANSMTKTDYDKAVGQVWRGPGHRGLN